MHEPDEARLVVEFREACAVLSGNTGTGDSALGDEERQQRLRAMTEYLLSCASKRAAPSQSDVAASAAALACAAVTCERDQSRLVAAAGVPILIAVAPEGARRAFVSRGAASALPRLISRSKSYEARVHGLLAIAAIVSDSAPAQSMFGTVEIAAVVGGSVAFEDRRAADNGNPQALLLLQTACQAIAVLTAGFDQGRRAFCTPPIRTLLLSAVRAPHSPTSTAGCQALATLTAVHTGNGQDWTTLDWWAKPHGAPRGGGMDGSTAKAWVDAILVPARRLAKALSSKATVTTGDAEHTQAVTNAAWLLRAATALLEPAPVDDERGADEGGAADGPSTDAPAARADVCAHLVGSTPVLEGIVRVMGAQGKQPSEATAALAGWGFRALLAAVDFDPVGASVALHRFGWEQAGELPAAIAQGVRSCAIEGRVDAAGLWPAKGQPPRVLAASFVREVLRIDSAVSIAVRKVAVAEGGHPDGSSEDGIWQGALGVEAVFESLCGLASVRSAAEGFRVRVLETAVGLIAAAPRIHKRIATSRTREALLAVVPTVDSPAAFEWLMSLTAEMATLTHEGQRALSHPDIRSLLVAAAASGDPQTERDVAYWTARATCQLSANNDEGKALLATEAVRDMVLLRIGVNTTDEGTKRWVAAAMCNVMLSGPDAAALFATPPVHDLLVHLGMRTRNDDTRQAIARAMCMVARVGDGRLRSQLVTPQMHDMLCVMGDMASSDEARSWLASALVACMRAEDAPWRFRALEVIEKLATSAGSDEARQWIERAQLGLQAYLLVEDEAAPDDSDAPRPVWCAPFQYLHALTTYEALVFALAGDRRCETLQLSFSSRLSSGLLHPCNGPDDLRHIDATNTVRPVVEPFAVPYTLVVAKGHLSTGPRGEARSAMCRHREVVIKKPSLFTQNEIDAPIARKLAKALNAELERAAKMPPHPNLRRPVGVVRDKVECTVGGTVLDVPVTTIFDHCPASLAQRVSRGTFLSGVEAHRIMEAVLQGLVALHAAGHAHGHLHPRNVLVRGKTAVIDDWFGYTVYGRASLAAQGVESRCFFPPEGETFLEHCEEDMRLSELPESARPVPSWDMWAVGFVALTVVGAVKQAPLLKGPAMSASVRPLTQSALSKAIDVLGVPQPWDALIRGCLAVRPQDRLKAQAALELFAPSGQS